MSDAQQPIDRIYRLVGTRVRDARTEAKLTQADLASRVGVTRSTIANFEAGRQRIPFHLFVMISLALNESPSGLLRDDDLKEFESSLSPAIREALAQSEESSQDFVREALANVGIVDNS